MWRSWLAGILGVAVAYVVVAYAAPPAGDPSRGARLVAQCAACHSLEPGRQLTGPSLASIWQRKAGSLEGFARYSDAMKAAGNRGLVWDAQTLDAWLRDPARVVRDNAMLFPGLASERDRRDLIAFLRGVSEGTVSAPSGSPGGMMTRQPRVLREAGPHEQVARITYCRDGYRVTTADGKTHIFWEFNLRLKTDSSADGPAPGRPVLLPASMQGDRAFVVFSAPEEISRAIRTAC